MPGFYQIEGDPQYVGRKAPEAYEYEDDGTYAAKINEERWENY